MVDIASLLEVNLLKLNELSFSFTIKLAKLHVYNTIVVQLDLINCKYLFLQFIEPSSNGFLSFEKHKIIF